MNGWGRASFLLGAGLFMAAGCGGRTGALFEDYDPNGTGADGTGGSSAGRGGRATGGTSVGIGGTNIGFSGSTSVGGGYPVGGASTFGGNFPGGSGPYPAGGAFPFGGMFPGGGTFAVGGIGPMPGGNCCDAQSGPSCQPRAVAKCVCAAGASYCCEKQWDEGCASLVQPLGCGVCEPYDCQTCIFQSCAFEVATCLEDSGCAEIFSCMEVTGCQGFQCYGSQYCRAIIDNRGGPGGASMSKLLKAFTCALSSGCPCN